MKTEQLTVKEALEQGYTKCGYAGTEWQSALDITELDESDFVKEDWRGELVLMSKQSSHPTFSVDQIKELLAETISERHSDETGDDTDNVYDTIMALDFTATADMIEKALSGCPFWWVTDIRLVP